MAHHDNFLPWYKLDRKYTVLKEINSMWRNIEITPVGTNYYVNSKLLVESRKIP